MSLHDYETLLKKIITFKGHDSDITFGELYKKTSINLNMNTYSIKQNKEIVINHITFPKLMLWQGMYMSSALPILVPPYEFEDDIYIDGGIVGNFIIEDIQENPDEIIAISSISNQINWSDMYEKIYNKNMFNYLSYTFKLINVAFIKHTHKNTNQYILLKVNNNETLNYKSPLLSDGFNFFMDENTKHEMIKTGYEQAKNQIYEIIISKEL